MTVDTISEAFTEFLEQEGYGVRGETLYLNKVPLDAPDTAYWVKTAGGSVIQKLPTGEKVKQYFVSVYLRSTSAAYVEKNLFSLEELLNCQRCVSLTGFEVQEIECQSFGQDDDIDSPERQVGFLQANIKIYKKEC